MRLGILLPGFSSDENDWAIPVQLNLVRELAKTDDVRVLALRYPHRRDQYAIHGVPVISLGAGQVRGFGRLRLWLDALRTLAQLHRQQPFDLLHAMWADETGLIAAWAGRWLNIPVVVSVAGGELANLADISYGLQRGAFSRWIVGQALTGANGVTVGCHTIRRMMVECGYSVPPENIKTVVLGVDTAVFSPLNARSATPPHRLVHAASLVGVKDQTMLLQALARLDASVTLDIIGDGPERGRLEKLAHELGLRERVNFVGVAEHLAMPGYYRGAALNLLTSRHEGLGMVTLEAAACGVPTVGTAVGLLADHPALGVSVPLGDAAALASAVADLLRDDVRRHALSQSAQHTVQNQFTIQHTAAAFREIYANLPSKSKHLS